MPDSEGRLWPEEVADLAGMKPGAVRGAASRTKRRMAQGHASKADLPVPVATVKRTVTTKGGHERTTWSPVWDADAIKAWLPERLGHWGHKLTGTGQ